MATSDSTLHDRFWSKVQKGDGCWLWRGGTAKGYGTFAYEGRRMRLAHRVALALSGVDVPGHLVVRHRCDTPLCVRPDHLMVGTQKDNKADWIAGGRKSARPLQRRALAPSSQPNKGTRKLDAVEIVDLKVAWKNGETMASLASRFGVSRSTVHSLIRGYTRSGS